METQHRYYAISIEMETASYLLKLVMVPYEMGSYLLPGSTLLLILNPEVPNAFYEYIWKPLFGFHLDIKPMINIIWEIMGLNIWFLIKTFFSNHNPSKKNERRFFWWKSFIKSSPRKSFFPQEWCMMKGVWQMPDVYMKPVAKWTWKFKQFLFPSKLQQGLFINSLKDLN